MKLNTDKCHLFLNSRGPNTMKISNLSITISSCKKLVGISFDYKLNFKKHTEDSCQKVWRKINALAKLVPCMCVTKQHILINVLYKSHFNYGPLIWMCCNRSLNNKTDQLHEECLWIIYSDKKSSFSEPLEKDGSVSIHYRNIRQLAIHGFTLSVPFRKLHGFY